MGLREWIIPQDRAFFDWFSATAKNNIRIVEALSDLMKEFGDVNAKRQQIKDLEHAGDDLTHAVFDALGRTFILPLDREDIAHLAKTLDDIADFVYAVANRIFLYEISAPTPAMQKFTEILQTQVRELAQAVDEIRSSKNASVVLRRGVEVNRLENQADRLLNETMAALFKEKDAIRIMKLKEIYEMLETATDKCEDAADILSDIVRKQG